MNTSSSSNHHHQQQQQHQQQHGSIVVVAKCPVAGQSKTRLIPLLGAEGAAILAKAMLCDVLMTLSSALPPTIRKVLLYAPPTQEGLHQMRQILDEVTTTTSATATTTTTATAAQLGLQQQQQRQRAHWDLLPILSTPTIPTDYLTSSQALGPILTDALIRTRHLQQQRHYHHHHHSSSSSSCDSTEATAASSSATAATATASTAEVLVEPPVVFVGMDCPELPLDEIQAAFLQYYPNQALLCPAQDGGYGLLSVPASVDAHDVFESFPMYWSHPLTAVAQLKALSDAGVPTRIGRLMHDMDEPADVLALVQRLQQQEEQQQQQQQSNNEAPTPTKTFENCLLKPSLPGATPETGTCHYTKLALTQLGLLPG